MSPTAIQKERIGHNDWLGRALKFLSKHGGAGFNIDTLCQGLGVTKGSFYAHFKDRTDFFEQILVYWSENFTEVVAESLDKMENSTGEERLLALMRLLRRERMARYDLTVRALAVQEPSISEFIRQVDRKRYNYVQQIFHDIGFRGRELNQRTRIFVAYHSLEEGINWPEREQDPDKALQSRFEFFVRA